MRKILKKIIILVIANSFLWLLLNFVFFKMIEIAMDSPSTNPMADSWMMPVMGFMILSLLALPLINLLVFLFWKLRQKGVRKSPISEINQ